MMFRRLLCWLFLLLASGSNDLFANVILTDATQFVKLGSQLEYLEDTASHHTIETVTSGAMADRWQSSDGHTLNFGYTGSTYWVRFSVENQGASSPRSMVEVAYPVLDHLEAFVFREGDLVGKYTMGDLLPFDHRPIAHPNFVFPMELQPGEQGSVYLRVRTDSSMQVPVNLYQDDTFAEKKYLEALMLALFVGAMMVMVAYNALILIGIRDISYFYYVMYVVSITVLLAGMHGLTFQFLWPNRIGLNDTMQILALSGIIGFASMFFRSFLALPQTRTKLSRLLLLFAVLAALIGIGSFFLPYRQVMVANIILGCIAIFAWLWSGVRRWLDGFATAKYLNIAWIFMMVSTLILALNKGGLVPRNWLTENIAFVGAILEVVLLSFALAHRMNYERRMREVAQKEAVRAQKTLLDHQIRANENLDRLVRQRTEELEEANEQLKRMSATDSLTNLLNRRAFDEVFSNEYKRAYREKTPLSVLMVDLDHFKDVNDTYGHPFGDICLVRTAAIILSNLRRPPDAAGRFGGEEFIILLPATDLEGAKRVAHNILDELVSTDMTDGTTTLRLTASIGVACRIPESNTNGQGDLVSEADQRLYVAKESGRNRVE